MVDANEFDDVIENGYESDHIEYKATQYSDKISLLKDIMAMANSLSIENKYIICGIKTDAPNHKTLIGIEQSEFKDSAEYQQLIYANIEPDLHVEYIPYTYHDYLIGIFKISDCNNKPYIMKKDYEKLKQGLCYIRKGSHQKVASREDYNQFYSLKEKIEVEIKDNHIFVAGNNGLAKIQILLRNYSNNPTTIMRGKLELSSKNGDILTEHLLYGFDKVEVGADFTMELKQKSERIGEALFGFESRDCLKLDMDPSGFKNDLTAKITIWDSNENEYFDIKKDIYIHVKGKALWKVKMREKGNNI